MGRRWRRRRDGQADIVRLNVGDAAPAVEVDRSLGTALWTRVCEAREVRGVEAVRRVCAGAVRVGI